MVLVTGKESGGGRDPLSNRLFELLYQARKRKGWTVRDLAAAAEISPSYVSLIENGHKSPDPGTLERIGKALSFEPRFLQALVTLQSRPLDPQVTADAFDTVMQHLGDLEAAGSKVDAVAPSMMRLSSMPAPSRPRARASESRGLMNYAATLRTELPDAAGHVVAIPMIEEGTEPGSDPDARGRRPLWLDRQALPERDELRGSFAWRLSSKGTERIRGVYRRGDIVIISPESWSHEAIHPLMVFAVRLGEGIVLSRASWTGEQLVLMNSGVAAPAILEAKGKRELRELIVGRVIVAVQRFR